MAAWWPFGRRRSRAPAAVDAAPPPPGDRAPSGAWRSLPPLRPSAPAIELTAPVQRLADTITPARHMAVSDEPLGHSRPADAPTGVVTGLLKPRAAARRELPGSAPLIFAAAAPEPVPAGSAAPLRWASVPTAPTRVDAPAPAAPSAAATTDAETPTPPLPPPGAPLGSATAPLVGAQRMPAAPSQLPALRPRPMAARAQPPVAVRPSPPEPAPGPGDLPVARQTVAAAAAADVASAPSEAVPRSAPASAIPTASAAPEASAVSVAPAPGRAPLVGTTRIVRRIGEPMRERPASMVASPEGPLPVATPPGVARMPETAAPAGQPRPRPPAPEPGAVPARPARQVAALDTPHPDLVVHDRPAAGSSQPPRPLVGARPPIQRLAGAGEAGAVLGSASGPASGVGASSPGADPVPVRWQAPVPATPRVQRAPEGVPADLRAELEPVLDTPLSDVKVHRDADTGAAARELHAKAFTAGGEVFLPDWHGPTNSGEARSILAHELTHVAQQRRLGSSLPAEDSPAGAHLESEARAVAGQGPPVATRPVARSGAAPRASRGPQRMSGEQPTAPVRHLASRQPSSGMSPLEVAARVQVAATAAGIASDTATTPAGAPSAVAVAGDAADVQRLPDEAPALQSSSVPSSSSSSTAAAAPVAESPAQLEELARRLYPRFRTRLRQDLLADRERTGRLFDMK